MLSGDQDVHPVGILENEWVIPSLKCMASLLANPSMSLAVQPLLLYAGMCRVHNGQVQGQGGG